MTLAKWITIIAALIVSPIIGVILSSVAKKMIGRPDNPEALRNSVKPIASLIFWMCIVFGLLVVLGIIDPPAVQELKRDFVSYIPRVLAAAIILIGANVAATFAVTALVTAMARMPFEIQQKVNLIVKVTILSLAALLAAKQLGLDTDVLNLFVASILFAIAASIALLIGLGGYTVARQVAATRAIKKVVRVADKISIDNMTGVVKSIHPTHVELTDSNKDKATIFVPAASFLENNVSVIDS